MKTFKNVLLIHPLDDQSLERALRLSGSSQVHVTLLAVAPLIERSSIDLESGRRINLQQLIVKDQQNELEELAAGNRSDGVLVSTRVVVGQPFYQITTHVIRHQHDLVVMTAEGQRDKRPSFLGTTAMHLMRKCPCPVWVVKPSRRKQIRKVLAAIDPSSQSDGSFSLNQEILKRASNISRTEGAEFHVVHAWNPLAGRIKQSRRWMSRTEFRLYAEQIAADHRGRMEESLHLAGCRHAKVHMIQGEAAQVVAEIAANENVDLLVMGTVCRTGIPGFFIGNTAEMVLNMVDCSVLTIKPVDFESPVQLADGEAVNSSVTPPTI